MRKYLNEEMIIMIHTTKRQISCPTGNNMTINNIFYLHLTIHSVTCTYTCIAILLCEFMPIVKNPFNLIFS